MNVLGISAYYHDAAACLVQDGKIVAAAQEERFTRKKHDAGFPRNAAAYCLRAGGVAPSGIDILAFYEKPITHFTRLIETYLTIAPRGLRSYLAAIPQWIGSKLWVPYELDKELTALGFRMPRNVVYVDHHRSHAGSAFFPSPYKSACVLTMDAVGEWATASIGVGQGNKLKLLRELRFPHSLGMLYSAVTYHCGFKVNSGEYKLMGLAPYGEPRYADKLMDKVIDLRPDGSFRLDMKYFDYLGGLTMTNERFSALFDGPPRKPEDTITKRERDLARSIQVVTENIVLKMARYAAMLTGEESLCLAGGVALNCVANGRLHAEGPFRNIWVQPAAGDAGGAIGSALFAWHHVEDHERTPQVATDGMSGAFLGPSFSQQEIGRYLDHHGYPHETFDDDDAWANRIAELVASGNVVGLFVGRMEFGPRALGHRSIIGDPRSETMQSDMNLKIKFRESFRPFAPAVLRERVADYFEFKDDSPYMLMVASVNKELRATGGAENDDLRQWVNQVRSTLPAITHVDYSARLQTVDAERNPHFYRIIKAFEQKTGCGVMINTSFNVRGEPIVCTPEDAYRCFMRTSMDYLVLERSILAKPAQPKFVDVANWREEFQLD